MQRLLQPSYFFMTYSLLYLRNGASPYRLHFQHESVLKDARHGPRHHHTEFGNPALKVSHEGGKRMVSLQQPCERECVDGFAGDVEDLFPSKWLWPSSPPIYILVNFIEPIDSVYTSVCCVIASHTLVYDLSFFPFAKMFYHLSFFLQNRIRVSSSCLFHRLSVFVIDLLEKWHCV